MYRTSAWSTRLDNSNMTVKVRVPLNHSVVPSHVLLKPPHGRVPSCAHADTKDNVLAQQRMSQPRDVSSGRRVQSPDIINPNNRAVVTRLAEPSGLPTLAPRLLHATALTFGSVPSTRFAAAVFRHVIGLLVCHVASAMATW